MNNIYEILMLGTPITFNDKGWPEYDGVEHVGFFYDKSAAYDSVKNNMCDLNECGAYNAALIVEIAPGLYPYPRSQYYFIYNNETDTYDERPLPEQWEHFYII